MSSTTSLDVVLPIGRTSVAVSRPVADRAACRDDSRTLVAIGLIVASTLAFALSDIAAKLLQTAAGADRITWWRYCVYFLSVVPFAVGREGRALLRPRAPGLQTLRALGAIGATLFFVYSLAFLQIPEATAITFVSPIFIMALSIVFLGEVVGIRRWAAAAVSFVGVLIIVQPGTAGFSLAALLPIASAISGAIATVATRRLLADSAETTMAWTATIGIVICTLVALPHASLPSLYEVTYGVATGVGFAVGQLLIVTAYRMAPVSILAPFSYVQLLSAGFLSLAVFGVLPTVPTLIGSAMIAACGVYSAHRERRRVAAKTNG